MVLTFISVYLVCCTSIGSHAVCHAPF